MRETPSPRALLEKGCRCVAAIGLIALAAACSDRQTAFNPVGPSSSAAPGATLVTSPPPAVTGGTQGTVVSRTVSGTLNGRFAFIPTGDDWWEFYATSDSTGMLTHFGRSSMHTTHNPDVFTGALREGTFRIVAANGDEILGTYEGSVTYDESRSDLVHGVATFVITGGTGRFARATGSFNVTFLETLDDPTWASAKVEWMLPGTVNY